MRKATKPLGAAWRIGLNAWRALWFAVIPALLAATAIHWLVPEPRVGSSGLERALRQLASGYPFYSPLALFLLFCWLLRHWRFSLPGGRYSSALAPELAARAAPALLAKLEPAAQFQAWLERPRVRARLLPELTGDRLTQFETQRAALASALSTLDVAAARSAVPALRSLLTPELRASRARELAGFAALLAAAALLAFALRGSAFQIYRVTSGSMLPSLVPGEYVLASRLAYALPGQKSVSVPARTNMVVFRRAGHEFAGDLVKRVIGLPGDRIEMVHGGHPKINGWEVPSCDAGQYLQFTPEGVLEGRLVVEFLEGETYLTVHTPWGQPMEPYTVKPGEVFVIGDDRNESRDSRSWADGKPKGLPLTEVGGRVVRSLVLALEDRPPRYRLLRGAEPLSLDLPGLDARDLESGIQRCLSSRPKQTQPPPPTRS
jgi:signal peptidase I